MLTKTKLSLLVVLAATTSLPLQASDKTGYWLNSTGEIVRTGINGCWQDMDYTKENAIAGCETGKKIELDSDNDGIVDSKDACAATMAGIKVDEKGCELDSDKDGIADSKDQCPTTKSGTKVDATGCAVDSDNDGVLNSADKCPDTPSTISVDASGCPKDSDGDGAADSYDKCPNTPAGAKVDATGCAINIDNDNDGIVNANDDCADTPAGTVVNKRGCKLKEEITLDNVQFKTGTSVLGTESRNILDNVAQILKQNPHLKFEVAGHTDNTGNYQSNVKLSESRAQSVRQYLTDKGVDSDRLTAKGYGPDKPVASNDSKQGRIKNRRVELVLQ